MGADGGVASGGSGGALGHGDSAPVRTNQLSVAFTGLAPPPIPAVIAITADGEIGAKTDLACL